MKSMSLVGIVLVVLGALALAYQGITYTHRETVLDVGPIHATKDTQEADTAAADHRGPGDSGRGGATCRGRKEKILTDVYGWG